VSASLVTYNCVHCECWPWPPAGTRRLLVIFGDEESSQKSGQPWIAKGTPAMRLCWGVPAELCLPVWLLAMGEHKWSIMWTTYWYV
jgi:hypothetical protein